MQVFDWRPFLEQYSRELLADRGMREQLTADVVHSGWMGFEPATEVEIRLLEDRLGAELPQSYRQFLGTTNGWRHSGGFIYEIWPCAKIEWFRVNNQDWIDAYVEPAKGYPPITVEEHCDYSPDQNCCRFRTEYLESTLLISDVGDSAVYLLNPEIRTETGEWEAWFFANWGPGATRYRSFWDLMQADCRSFIDLRDHNERRYFPEDGLGTLPKKLPGLIADLAEKALSHHSCQEGRISRGQVAPDPYSEGIISALKAAEVDVQTIAEMHLSPPELLRRLTDLAADLEHQRKSTFRPNTCGISEQDGRSEGSREAMGIIRWFLNQPQS